MSGPFRWEVDGLSHLDWSLFVVDAANARLTCLEAFSDGGLSRLRTPPRCFALAGRCIR